MAVAYDLIDGVVQSFNAVELERKEQQAITSPMLQSTNLGWDGMIKKRAEPCQRAVAVGCRPILHALLNENVETSNVSNI